MILHMSDYHRLTLQELEEYQPSKARPKNRYYCPIHGGDNQPSIIVDSSHPSARWKCMNCGAYGYLEAQNRKPEKANTYQQRIQAREKTRLARPSEPIPAPLDMSQLAQAQAELQGSPGERYLKARGISLETARAYGLGYSADGRPLKPWKWGRVVFPHTDTQGRVISLYGRAIDGITSKQAPKEQKHMHLQGKKRVFNAPALKQPAVFICEGPFDALALLEAGYPAVALYGLHGLPWAWVEADELILCLDNDQAGSEAVWKLAEEADNHGKRVYKYSLPAGIKDVSEAWNAGNLDIIGQIDPDLHLWMLNHWQKVYLTPENKDEMQPLYDALEHPEEYRRLASQFVKC